GKRGGFGHAENRTDCSPITAHSPCSVGESVLWMCIKQPRRKDEVISTIPGVRLRRRPDILSDRGERGLIEWLTARQPCITTHHRACAARRGLGNEVGGTTPWCTRPIPVSAPKRTRTVPQFDFRI